MKKPRRRRAKILVPVASMGDIAFLLVIFFVLCSHIPKSPGTHVDPPTTPEVSELDDYPTVVVIDDEGRIFVKGKRIDSAEQVEEEIREAIAGKTSDRDTTVIFRCDRTRNQHLFEPVIEAIAKGGGRIALVGVKSKSE